MATWLPVPFITRVRLTNYKSIASCDVRLGPLTLLVGPNGSGKSNFLDALAFVARAIGTTPDEAINERGGLAEILRRVPEPADSMSLVVDVVVPWGPTEDQWARGEYGFAIGSVQRHGQRPFQVLWERCVLTWQDETRQFDVLEGAVSDPEFPSSQRIEDDRLYLQVASARTTFAPLFVALRGMSFYNPELDVLRQLQSPTTGERLGPQGEHLGDVLGALEDSTRQRVNSYLAAIVPDLNSLGRRYECSYVTAELVQRTGSGGTDVKFGPNATSDGTVRAAAILASLFQPWVASGRIRLIGIEEPELALHPGAAGVLFDALSEASERVQVIATSQSADLIDRDGIDPGITRAVVSDHGLTAIGELDDASQLTVRERRFTLGELMRANQLEPRRAGNGVMPLAGRRSR